MPHVTLVYPFMPAERFDEAVPPKREACRLHMPFEITLAEFHTCRQRRGNHPLWLRPEPVAPRIELHAAFVASLKGVFGDIVAGSSRPFRPHLSVGQVQGAQRLRELQGQFQSVWQPVRFPVSEVSLLQRSTPPADVFRVARSVMLGTSR